MYRLYFTHRISCAHRLTLPYESPCKELHGHNYLIECFLEGKKLNTEGMLVDFNKLKELLNKFNHKDLNSFFTQPTTEILAHQFALDIKKLAPNLEKIKVRVWESEKGYAEYET